MNRKSAGHRTSLGKRGEEDALRYLQHLGYILLHQNLRLGRSEVDLVMIDLDEHVFVEVKSRSGRSDILPEENIKAGQWKALQRAADVYCREQKNAFGVRFDIVAVTYHQNTRTLVHHKDVILPLETVD